MKPGVSERLASLHEYWGGGGGLQNKINFRRISCYHHLTDGRVAASVLFNRDSLIHYFIMAGHKIQNSSLHENQLDLS